VEVVYKRLSCLWGESGEWLKGVDDLLKQIALGMVYSPFIAIGIGAVVIHVALAGRFGMGFSGDGMATHSASHNSLLIKIENTQKNIF